ncbi:MAG TPA: S41 family peptidase [Blastocatellia bacterium]|nr:S41 family peptidase [Blastocatellia bacterium]
MSKIAMAVLFLLAGFINVSAQQPAPALYGRLAVNQTHIVFTYAGDLWSVERGGGEARRITTHPGEESYPAFSPDGSQLAFSRQIGGNWDIYVMPATGGEARQITYQPRNDYAYDWTPDGKTILFMSGLTGGPRLYTIALDGVLQNELPLRPEALNGSFSPDGKRVVYSPTSAIGDWRFYRGGSKGQIWLANPTNGDIEKLPQGNYNDDFPAWVGNKIYFLSDRTGIYNLYSYDLSSKQTKQLTTFEHHGVRWLGAGAGAVAFVRDGRIHLHDAATGQTRVVDVRLSPDTAELKPRTVNAARGLESVLLNASGDRVIFGARGEAMIFDPSTGNVRNITATSGVAERFPALSPDGKMIAYFSDESGEYQLHARPASGEGPVKKIAIEPKPSFYRELIWSPDSKKVAFTDRRLALWLVDVESSTASRIDSSTYSYQQEWYPQWSPDSRWLAYSKHLGNRVRTVFVYDVEGKRARQITDGRTHTELPCFDANGKYLYFASSPNAGTSEFGWGVLNGIMARPLVTRRLHAIILQNDSPSPILPTGTTNPEAKAGEAISKMRIDFENISRRVIDLPTPSRDYALLATGKPGVLFALISEWPATPGLGSNPTPVLYKIDLTQTARPEKFVEGTNGFEVSRDGNRLIYVKGGSWFLVSADAVPKADDGKLDLKKMEVTIDPRAEFKQIYREAWRIMRDWFYEPNYHGQNLAELEAHFAEYLPTVTRRADLNALMNRMLGHISVSHLGVGGGDQPQPAGPPVRIGLLGADYEIANGRYLFKHIYRATSYNSPFGSAQAPLDAPGVSVREGEYLLAVDGQEISSSKSIYAEFNGKVNQPVKITVGPNPTGDGARTITVFPIPNESGLRTANWAEDNRRRVEEASGGKLGYIFVESYGPGIFDFIRGLVGYSDRPGIIIDQRYNGGGVTSDYLIEWLQRKPLYYYAFREGDDIATPVNPGPRAKVLITNEQNFSAAETFAFMYKLAKVGPIVGTRTGGGGIGPYAYTPRFIDGGNVQLPNRAAYNPDGTSWGIENVGVIPDYEVEIMPKDMLGGRDPQLEKAIQVGLEEIKKNIPVAPKKPKYPVHK